MSRRFTKVGLVAAAGVAVVGLVASTPAHAQTTGRPAAGGAGTVTALSASCADIYNLMVGYLNAGDNYDAYLMYEHLTDPANGCGYPY
ncbi:MAG: hypothetical protein J2P15_00495 [Micromonosporaceae bacterium]|nr:hypothetical protein [Micromonosporaceae bacterium]